MAPTLRLLGFVPCVFLAARGAEARQPNRRPESPVRLSWSAPAECPDRARVQSDVLAQLGDVAKVVPLDAEGRVTRAGANGEWTMLLSMGSGGARVTRELSAPTCDELAKAAATLLAIAVSPSPGDTDAPAPAPERVPSPIDAAPATRPPPATEASTSSAFTIAALAGGSAGAVDLSAGVAAALAWLPRWGRIEVVGFWSPPSQINASPGISGTFALWSIGGRACTMFGEGRLGVGACGGVESGQISATGSGANVIDPTTERRLWAAGNAGGLLLLRVGSFALRLQAELVIPIFRPRFLIDTFELVYRPAFAGGRLLSGVELHFP